LWIAASIEDFDVWEIYFTVYEKNGLYKVATKDKKAGKGKKKIVRI